MPEHIAIKPMTIGGKEYRPGQVVPMADLPPKVQQQLVDQRRVVANTVRVTVPGRKGG